MDEPRPLDYETPPEPEPRVPILHIVAAACPKLAVACPIVAVAVAIALREAVGPSTLVAVGFVGFGAIGLLAGLVTVARSPGVADGVFRLFAGFALYVVCAFVMAFYAMTRR
jgi:hypothetical protein